MATYRSTYYSPLYREFKSIDPRSYRDLVRFYEKNETEIRDLNSEEESIDMLVSYVNALFEIGAYRKHLLLVDHVVEAAVAHNIYEFEGKDLFRQSLFKKAASLFNTHQFKKAQIILRQLVRMDPYEPYAIRFLKKCIRRCRPRLVNTFRATSVFMLLLTALVIAVEVLFVRPFYDMHTPVVEMSRNSLFVLACLILIGGFLYNRWLAEREVEELVYQMRERKKRKSAGESPIVL